MTNENLVPWETKSTKINSYRSGSEGDLVKIGDDWFVLCLRIGTPSAGRWYARKSDKTQWSISVVRATEYVSNYDWSREKTFDWKKRKDVKNKFMDQAKVWLAIMNDGVDLAHSIRDRISTRRANTVARRSRLGGLGGGLF